MPVRRPVAKKVKVDFTGVEAGGRALPDGYYRAKCKEVSQEIGESSKQPYIKWVWGIQGGGQAFDNISLQPQALFKLKGLLEAMGVDVPDGTAELDLAEYVGFEVGLEIVNEEYQGKKRPKVVGYMPVDQVTDGEAVATESAPSGKSSAFKAGHRVKFKDEDGKFKTGTITSVSADTAAIDVNGEEWEVGFSELETA